MTNTHEAIQILLTLIVTGGCTLLAMQFVTVANEKVRLQKWFMWTVRVLMLFHSFAFPASFINLIWSV